MIPEEIALIADWVASEFGLNHDEAMDMAQGLINHLDDHGYSVSYNGE